MIIFKAGAHLMGHHTYIEIEEKEDAYFSIPSKGYTNTAITFKWFRKVFEPSTRPVNGIEDHRILLLDGHSAITLAGIACIIMREVYATMGVSIYPNPSFLSRDFPEASGRLLKNHKEFTFQDMAN